MSTSADRPERMSASALEASERAQERGDKPKSTNPGKSIDPQEKREHQGGRGTKKDDKGPQGGVDENDHGDDVSYPQK